MGKGKKNRIKRFKKIFKTSKSKADGEITVAIDKIYSFIESVWGAGFADDFNGVLDNEKLNNISIKAGDVFTNYWGEDYKSKRNKSYSF